MINHKLNNNFKSHIIFERIQNEFLVLFMLDTYIGHREKTQNATYCFYFLIIFSIQNNHIYMRTGQVKIVVQKVANLSHTQNKRNRRDIVFNKK